MPNQSKHIVLLGDSIFDNQVYIPKEPCVSAHLRQETDQEVTLLAMDGAITLNVLDYQVSEIPKTATHLVLSVGGNDALRAFYQRSLPDELEAATNEFVGWYAELIRTLQATGLPLLACTIYCDCPIVTDDQILYAMQNYLPWYNRAIMEILKRHNIPLIDLRQICTEPEDYAASSPIEPSNQGGHKIAIAIKDALDAL